MSSRSFAQTTERQAGQFRTVSRLNCRKCGVSESIGVKAAGGNLPDEVVAKKFTQKGWTVGANEQWDYCPGCTNKMKEKKPVMLKVVNQVKPAPSQEPPREMSRDDRRIIISKLDAVYLDSKRGYDSGWSDQKVASDLGVPRRWVEIIRAENFGDVGTNDEMSEFYRQANDLAAEARKMVLTAREECDRANAAIASANKSLLGFLDRLSKVEKLGEAVRKYVV